MQRFVLVSPCPAYHLGLHLAISPQKTSTYPAVGHSPFSLFSLPYPYQHDTMCIGSLPRHTERVNDHPYIIFIGLLLLRSTLATHTIYPYLYLCFVRIVSYIYPYILCSLASYRSERTTTLSAHALSHSATSIQSCHRASCFLASRLLALGQSYLLCCAVMHVHTWRACYCGVCTHRTIKRDVGPCSVLCKQDVDACLYSIPEE